MRVEVLHVSTAAITKVIYDGRAISLPGVLKGVGLRSGAGRP